MQNPPSSRTTSCSAATQLVVASKTWQGGSDVCCNQWGEIPACPPPSGFDQTLTSLSFVEELTSLGKISSGIDTALVDPPTSGRPAWYLSCYHFSPGKLIHVHRNQGKYYTYYLQIKYGKIKSTYLLTQSNMTGIVKYQITIIDVESALFTYW